MSLEALAAFAAANNNAGSRSLTPVYELSIEDARKRIKIGDGNRKAKEDGTQALTLSLGKHKVALDAVAPNATRVNAPADKVEAFTAALQEAIDNGTFDAAIIETQANANPANRPVVEASVVGSEPVVEGSDGSAPEGVDLDELD